MLNNIGNKELLNAGVHFGHLVRKWDPRMAPYIFMERSGIHIIDLNKTIECLKDATEAIKNVARTGRKILFVATKKQAKEVIQQEARRLRMPYVTERWLGGMLTNFSTVRKSIKKMTSMHRNENDEAYNSFTKKERLMRARKQQKMEKVLGGISELNRLPAALFIVDVKKEHIAVNEALKLSIPIYGMVDTNSNPDQIHFVIPSNDDASKAIALITEIFGKAIEEGLEERKNLKEEEYNLKEKNENQSAAKPKTKGQEVLSKESNKKNESKQQQKTIITAKHVNKLRQMTGAGMMDCKKALVESNGDFEAAIVILRKRGQKVSTSRADKEASEGVIFIRTNDNATEAILLALNCETDFVSRNEEFTKLGEIIAEAAYKNKPESIEKLLELSVDGKSVNEYITDLMGKIGEKVFISAYEEMKGEKVIGYVHSNSKLGVLVALKGVNSADITEVGKDVALQIASMNPIAIDKDDIDPKIIEKEIEIGKEQAKTEGKTNDLLEKVAKGKLQKFYKDNTLLNQPFVKDSSKTIAQLLNGVHKGLTVSKFKRVMI